MNLVHASFALFASLAVACTALEGPANDAGATADDITSCKSSCDTQQRFSCMTAAEQKACYNDCNDASPDSIRAFDGCTGTQCDPTCRLDTPAAKKTTSDASSTASNEPAKKTTTSSDTAESTGGNTTVTVSAPDPKVDDDSEIKRCQTSCDSVHFFKCITAAELTTCRKACGTVKAETRNTFSACASGVRCNELSDCYGELTAE